MRIKHVEMPFGCLNRLFGTLPDEKISGIQDAALRF